MKQAVHRSNGFTFVELLVTIAIIAVLTVIGIVSYSTVNQRSRDVKRKSDLEQIRSALEMFKSDSLTGEYPNSSGYVNSVLGILVTKQYIPVLPDDSDTTKPYWYQAVSTGTPPVYTGYCLSAKLEITPVTPNACTPYGAYNYGLKNP